MWANQLVVWTKSLCMHLARYKGKPQFKPLHRGFLGGSEITSSDSYVHPSHSEATLLKNSEYNSHWSTTTPNTLEHDDSRNTWSTTTPNWARRLKQQPEYDDSKLSTTAQTTQWVRRLTNQSSTAHSTKARSNTKEIRSSSNDLIQDRFIHRDLCNTLCTIPMDESEEHFQS